MVVKLKPSQLETIESEVQVLADTISISPEGLAGVLCDRVSISTDTFDLVLSLPHTGMTVETNERNFRSLRIKDLLGKVDDLGLNVSIPTYDILDDKFGVYAADIRSMIAAAQNEYDRRTALALQANALTPTGVALFSDTQSWFGESTTQDNNLGLALDETNLASAISALESFKDADGQPLNRMATHLIVPPQLKATARKLCASQSVYGGYASFGDITVVSSGYLSNQATTWYVADASGQRPLRLFDRMAPVATTVEDVLTKSTKVMIDARFKVVPAYWCNIVKSVG